MNKTVNINLAGIFFHIDEDAYLKLQRYLDAIKKSFTDSQGRSEIIADIEARIAELFTERVQNDRQVIRIHEVDEVILIMGQPEDYLVDDEIFEDEPSSNFQSKTQASSVKKLYRDGDNSYIGGVASGLGHYLGVDAIWVRLLWILLAFGSGGTFIFIYILFWILVPEAVTTAEKLTMKGEPVNISNIEKKIKNGFENVSQNVSDAVKNIDLPSQGNRIKTGSKSFFDALGTLILLFFKIIGKFIGIFLIIVGITVLIALIVAFFSVGVAEIINVPGMDFIEATNAAHIPIWTMSLLLLFAVGIPFFFLFYLGLKILITNLKSIGNVAKFSLLGLWLISVIALVVFGVKQASEYAEEAFVQENVVLNTRGNDTLIVSAAVNNAYSKQKKTYGNDWKPIYNDNGEKILYLTDVDIAFKSTTDSVASITIEKSALGNTYQNAKKRADNIQYEYKINGNNLLLNAYLTTAFENKYRDQEVAVTVYIPEETTLYLDKSVSDFKNRKYRSTSGFNSNKRNISNNLLNTEGWEGHYLQIQDNEILCIDCPDELEPSTFEQESNEYKENQQNDSLESKTPTSDQNHRVKVNIDENGINITSDKNQ